MTLAELLHMALSSWHFWLATVDDTDKDTPKSTLRRRETSSNLLLDYEDDSDMPLGELSIGLRSDASKWNMDSRPWTSLSSDEQLGRPTFEPLAATPKSKSAALAADDTFLDCDSGDEEGAKPSQSDNSWWPVIQQTFAASIWLTINKVLIPGADCRPQPALAGSEPTPPEPSGNSPSDAPRSIVWQTRQDDEAAPSKQDLEDDRLGLSSTAEPDTALPDVPPLLPATPESTGAPDTSAWKLLPPMRPEHSNRKTLVLDLDETLVHSVFHPVPGADMVVTVLVEGIPTTVYVHKRPGVDEFLKAAAKLFEVVIFTASVQPYADALVDLLDPSGELCHHRLFRGSCVWWKSSYVKDLSLLGRDLSKSIIVDNSPLSYAFQPENALPILSFYEDRSDVELYKMISVLEKLAAADVDVRRFEGLRSLQV